MSRCLLKIHAEDLSGNVSSGALLTFFQFGTTTPITESLYKAATGTATYSPSEKVTDGNGNFVAYKTTGERMSVIATKSGEIVTTTEEAWWDPADLTGLIFSAGVRGAVADGVVVTDASMSATNNLLNSATANFTLADEGKVVHVYVEGTWVEPSAVAATGTSVTSNAGAEGRGGYRVGIDEGKEISIPGAGAGGLVPHVTTIASIVDINEAVLSQAVSTAVTGKTAVVYPYYLRSVIVQYVSPTQVRLANSSLRTITGATLAYGTDQAVSIQAAIDAASAAGGGTVEFPGDPNSIYMTSQLTMRSRVHLSGFATLRRIPSFDPVYDVTYVLPANNALIYSATALSDVVVQDLTIHNDRGQGYGFMTPVGNTRVTVRNLTWSGQGPFPIISFNNDLAGAHIVANSAMNKHITIKDNYFEGVYARNGGSFNINNPQNFRFEGNTLEYLLSLDLSMSQDAVDNSYDVFVRGNRTNLIACSWLFVSPGANVAATSASQRYENVVITDNNFRSTGWFAGKGMIVLSIGSKADTTLANVVIANNTFKTWGQLRGGTAIVAGDTACQLRNITITNNVLDGTLLSGALQTWSTFPAINAEKIVNLQVSGNTIRNCGGNGIRIQRVTDGIIANNMLSYTCQLTGANGGSEIVSRNQAAIFVMLSNQGVTVEGNIVRNTGNGNWLNDGIAVSDLNSVDYPTHTINQDIRIIKNTVIEDRAGASAATRYAYRVGCLAATTTANMPLNVQVIGNTMRWQAGGNRGESGTNVKDPTSAIGTVGVMIFPQYQQGNANTLTPFVLGAVQDRRIVAYDNWGDYHPTIDEVLCQVALPASAHARFFLPSTDVPGAYEVMVQVKTGGTYAISRYSVIVPAANANPVVSAVYGAAALTLTAPTLTAVAVCQADVLNNDASDVELLVTGRSVRRGAL